MNAIEVVSLVLEKGVLRACVATGCGSYPDDNAIVVFPFLRKQTWKQEWQAMFKQFRIFLCSTLDDWKLERECLCKNVFLKLKGKFEHKGGKLLLVDLSWGISEAAGKVHATVDTCLDEVRRCQKVSSKTFFWFFLEIDLARDLSLQE